MGEEREAAQAAAKYARKMSTAERAAFIELFDEHRYVVGWDATYSKFERDGLLDICGTRMAMSPMGKALRTIILSRQS